MTPGRGMDEPIRNTVIAAIVMKRRRSSRVLFVAGDEVMHSKVRPAGGLSPWGKHAAEVDQCVFRPPGTVREMQKTPRLRLRRGSARSVIAAINRPGRTHLAAAVMLSFGGLVAWAVVVGGVDRALFELARGAVQRDVAGWLDTSATILWLIALGAFAAAARHHEGPSGDLTSVFSATSERASSRRPRGELLRERRSATMFVAVFATGVVAWFLR